MSEEVERARDYFGAKPEESFAWKMVDGVVKLRGGRGLDPKSDEDLVWAFAYVAGGCGMAG